MHSPSDCLVKYIICHSVIFYNKIFKNRPTLKQGGMLPNNTKALSKHIVSFRKQLRKRNTRSSLAVIFVPIFSYT
nr:MAG TPA: hypothetical protein [Caudoviricetes sp.]